MKHLFVILALLFTLGACNSSKEMVQVEEEIIETKDDFVMENNIDSLSYAIGLSIAQNFQQQDLELNGEALARAIQDMKDDSVSWHPQLANQYIQEELKQIEEKKAETLKAPGVVWLKNNANNPNVTTTPSGLQYSIIEQGTGAYPKSSDKVTVHYTGTLTDGTKFDSSVDRGTPATFPLSGVIKGWTEGLQLVQEGGKIRLFIPEYLAYGKSAQATIPAYSTLIFDVELIEIVKE